MEAPSGQQSNISKKMVKQLMAKRDDTPLQSLVRAGSLDLVMEMICKSRDSELKQLLSKQNQSGETPLYVAAEYGYADLVKEIIKNRDIGFASTKARNGYDAFHIAAKQGNLEVLKVLMEAIPELSMTCDSSNTTALHTAASQGHIEVVNFILEKGGGSVATIAKSNAKTALHSAARNGHVEIVMALLSKEPGIATRVDKKGQTALHMAVKGLSVELVDELLNSEPSLINMADTKGNTALNIATRKGRAQVIEFFLFLQHILQEKAAINKSGETNASFQIVRKLLIHTGVDKAAIDKSGETALDTAEKNENSEIKAILQEYGVQHAKFIKPAPKYPARELKQTVSDIKHEVHDQLEHTCQTRKRVNKMHSEGLNNAINSTTVVAVLIATVAFAAIFSVPGQYVDDPEAIPPNLSLGEANIAPKPAFMVFFIVDAIALFVSLAVVVIQTSVVVIESEAKKQMMAVINKLMWLACVMISIAFLALSFIVLGDDNMWWAVAVTSIGTVIMVSTLGTLCYWVIINRIDLSKLKSIRRSSLNNRSRSMTMSVMSDPELLSNEYKKLYAV